MGIDTQRALQQRYGHQAA
jgi:RES domain